jgi:hypothetical protein
MNWFKLIGATDSQLAEDWAVDESINFTEIWFPWSKPPKMISKPDRIILYAVGHGLLVAEQTVDGPPQLRPRRGPVGSPENRWPHRISVRTHYFCSPLSTAPKLRDVAPAFAQRHAKKFRNGSHWRISDAEYEELAMTIREHGQPYPA